MERLHAKGLISDPVGKAKSVVFTDEGLLKSEALFRKFSKLDPKHETRSPEFHLHAAQTGAQHCFKV
jgi:hypothetical protein